MGFDQPRGSGNVLAFDTPPMITETGANHGCFVFRSKDGVLITEKPDMRGPRIFSRRRQMRPSSLGMEPARTSPGSNKTLVLAVFF